MSALVEWLRFQDKTYGAEELGKAADEIERLQRENEELRQRLAVEEAHSDKYRRENEELREELASEQRRASQHMQEAAALKGMVEYEQATTDRAVKTAQSLQAKLDAVMLEYCHDEMTPEQLEEWGKHQRPVKQESAEPLTAGYLQKVPDKCDRIFWRNSYYMLPLKGHPRAAVEDFKKRAKAAVRNEMLIDNTGTEGYEAYNATLEHAEETIAALPLIEEK